MLQGPTAEATSSLEGNVCPQRSCKCSSSGGNALTTAGWMQMASVHEHPVVVLVEDLRAENKNKLNKLSFQMA